MISAMFVDDEILAIRMLEKLIDWEAYDINIKATALNGEEALLKLNDHQIDIIITDIAMPQMNGLDFIKHLRAKGYNTEIIFISAHADFKFVQQAMRLGCIDYILKPIDEEELEKTIITVTNRIKTRNINTSVPDHINRDDNEIKRTLPKAIRSDIVLECITLLNERYAKDVSLDDICMEIGVSKNYFCSLFKKETGKRIWEYLTEIRMEKAKELLRNTKLRNYEIASEVGYNNVEHYMKIFKKLYNETPNEYRARNSK